MKLKLISFKLCPFVQRAVIALQAKAIDYDIEYIDLAVPPDWFLQLSPRAKVPLLLVDGEVIFESTVINEYIDEAFSNKLHPDNLVRRAQNRSWIEFGNECMWSAFHLSTKESEQAFDEELSELWNKFDRIESLLNTPPFFNGAALSLVDVCYAPLLQRLSFLEELRAGIFDKQRHPRIYQWKDNLMALDAVKQSTVPEIKTLYYRLLCKRQGYIAQFVDASKYATGITKGTY